VYPTDNTRVTWASYSDDNPRFAVVKTLLFLVPEITRDSRDNSEFQKPRIKVEVQRGSLRASEVRCLLQQQTSDRT